MKMTKRTGALICALALLTTPVLTTNLNGSAIAQSVETTEEAEWPGQKPDGQPPEKPDGGGAPGEQGKPPQKPDGQRSGERQENTGTGARTITQAYSATAESFLSDQPDENALRAEGASVILDSAIITKSGDTTDQDASNFYGMNAGALALLGGSLTLTEANVTTDASGANAVCAYGAGSMVSVLDSVIHTSKDNSGGIHVAGGGSLNAANLDVETQGNSSAAIRSDRGGGTMVVEGGRYVTNGTGSPAVYSTADITVLSAQLNANHSEAVVVEGMNSVTLVDCQVTGNMDGTYPGDSDENIHGVMIYQSMSGDAEEGRSQFAMTGGKLTTLAGDLFYVTNTECQITLSDVELALAGDNLLVVSGNDGTRGWGKPNENGGNCVLEADEQKLTGVIEVDAASTLDLSLTGGSDFSGTINPAGQAGTVSVRIESGSTWTLTDDAYVTALEAEASSINKNGHTLYVNGEAA